MEKQIVKCLPQGMNQKGSSVQFAELGFILISLSTIEKTIEKQKLQHGAKTIFYLGEKITLLR